MLTFLCLIFLSFNQPDGSSDKIAQWRGPDRNGVYKESNLLRTWPEDGPELAWSYEGIGDGFSSVSIYNGTIYATGKKDSIEYLTALDKSGNQLWQLPYGLASRQSFPETRCTPTVEGDNVYVISGRGEVVCVDVTHQKIRWKVEALTKFQGAYATWEIAESPLLVDDKVIYTPGGDLTTMIALNKHTGETTWTTESMHDSTAYSSPIVIERGGKKIITAISRNYFFGVNASDGKILWSYDYGDLEPPTFHPEAPFINCNSPIYHDGQIFITSGYDHTAAMFNLSEDGNEISLLWQQPALDTHHGGVVHLNGYLYGSNWIDNSRGNWVCVDWQTGELKYEHEWQTKGSIIAADNMLYLYEERRGHIGLAEPDPNNFEIVSSFRNRLGFGPHWAHPVIKEGVLYIRHGKVLSAFKIKVKT